MSFAASPDSGHSGHSGPRTPPRGQAQHAKSSPVSKVPAYFLPENREQYQKFDYNPSFLLEPFNKSEFLEFLNGRHPKSVLDIRSRGKGNFVDLANKVARCVKDDYFSNHDLLVFHDMGNKSPPGHVTDTKCKPDITAAFESHGKNGVVPWPFIQLAGEMASAGKSCRDQMVQAISYLHYLLLARPDLYVAQGLLSSDEGVTFLIGIGGEGIRQFHVKWNDQDFYELLYAFIYRLYGPGDFADLSYIKTELDDKSTATYTINIIDPGGTKACPGFYSIYARNPFATRTHVLSNPNLHGGNDFTVLKDQLCRVRRRFTELDILNKYVHKPEGVPGVVVATYGEIISYPRSEERHKHRLGLGESGSPFMSIPTLSNVLETLFDVLEVLRYLRRHREVLHRDISSGNVLYVENSKNRPLPPNSLSVPPLQEGETRELPLCYAKYLQRKSDNPLETSMLLVDFNLAEYLGPATSVENKRTERTGTPIFMARAVEQSRPVPQPPVVAVVPGIPNNPDSGLYAKAHPDRVEVFRDFPKKKKIIDPDEPDELNPSQDSGWRHKLDHDVESVFWLLLYWAMVVQPEGSPEEEIEAHFWSALNDNHESRDLLLSGACVKMSSGLTHSFYKPLQPLIKDLAAILVIDSHWLPASDLRRKEYYITEAFQRLILKFIIDYDREEFMNHHIETTFRTVEGMQASNAVSFTKAQSVDVTSRERVNPGADDVEMNDIQ